MKWQAGGLVFICAGILFWGLACQASEDPIPIPTLIHIPTASPSPLPPTASPSPSLSFTPSFTHTFTPPPASPSLTWTPKVTRSPTAPALSQTPSPLPVSFWGQVSSDVGAYFRAGPGVNFEPVGEILSGGGFSIVAYTLNAEDEVWYAVPDGRPGGEGRLVWIADLVADLLPPASLDQVPFLPNWQPSPVPSPTGEVVVLGTLAPSPSPALPQGTNALVTGDLGVNLRAGASYGYPILDVLDKDSPLVLIGRDEGAGWFQAVTFTSPSLMGWVNADFVGPLFDSRLLAVTWSGPTAIAGVPCGVNIHPKNGEGDLPTPPDLSRSAWVRFPFMASPIHFPNLEAAFLFYDPIIAAYVQIGAQIILVLTHETYGEAAGWDWLNMTSGDWARFAPQFAGVAEKIATRYRSRVAAYEVWNEGDAQPGNEAAVAISPQDYAPLLNASAAAIRRADPGARVILGGLLDPSGGYLREVKRALGGRLPVDGVGIHPYGRGAPADPSVFARFGSLGEVIDNYQAVAPGLPLWITEIGALGDNSPSRWGEAAAYMQALVDYLRTAHSQTVEVLLWYGWSDGMHVSQRPNGLLGMDGRPKPPLYETFFRLCGG